MNGDSFALRVRDLRQSWNERRQLRELAQSHDFASQLGLLVTLHEWSEHCVKEINAVYGPALSAAVSPRPEASSPAFSVMIGNSQTITFALAERTVGRAVHWFVSARVAAARRASGASQLGPSRRDGQWTRSRLEDVLLSALGAYERASAEGELAVELRGA